MQFVSTYKAVKWSNWLISQLCSLSNSTKNITVFWTKWQLAASNAPCWVKCSLPSQLCALNTGLCPNRFAQRGFAKRALRFAQSTLPKVHKQTYKDELTAVPPIHIIKTTNMCLPSKASGSAPSQHPRPWPHITSRTDLMKKLTLTAFPSAAQPHGALLIWCAVIELGKTISKKASTVSSVIQRRPLMHTDVHNIKTQELFQTTFIHGCWQIRYNYRRSRLFLSGILFTSRVPWWQHCTASNTATAFQTCQYTHTHIQAN